MNVLVRNTLACALAAGVAALALGSIGSIVAQTNAKRPASHKLTPITLSAPVAATPVTIAAIRAHPVPGGTIHMINNLPSRGGCNDSLISYPSDGLTINALMQTPPTPAPAGGYPVIILAHGYIKPASYSATGTDYQPFLDALCAHGYAVIKASYRGDGTAAGASYSGQFSPDYAYDILNLTASLKTLPQINATRVGLLAHSMGGAVVLRTIVATHSLPIKAVAFVNGVVASLPDIADNWPNMPSDVPPHLTAFTSEYGTPQQNPTLWHDASAINYVSSANMPIQIDVDSGDSVVPPAFSASLDQALISIGKTPQYFVYPGDDHQFAIPVNRALLLSRLVAFYAAHI